LSKEDFMVSSHFRQAFKFDLNSLEVT